MALFELRTSGIGGDHSTNWAITTAQNYIVYLSLEWFLKRYFKSKKRGRERERKRERAAASSLFPLPKFWQTNTPKTLTDASSVTKMVWEIMAQSLKSGPKSFSTHLCISFLSTVKVSHCSIKMPMAGFELQISDVGINSSTPAHILLVLSCHVVLDFSRLVSVKISQNNRV